MSDVVTVSELLGRSISVEWQEAIAIVRGVAAHLLSDRAQPPRVPELHQVGISRDGQIEVVGGKSTAEPVRRLGQLLQATVGQSNPPVQLRLIIAQATAPEPLFGSVREYDEALEYFERPDRSAVLRHLHRRAAAAPSTGTSAPTLDAIAPFSTPEQAEIARVRAARRRRLVRRATVAGLLIVACAVTWQYAGVTLIPPRIGGIVARARRISETAGLAILSAVSALTERAGFGRLVSRDAIAAAPPAVEATTPPAPSGGRKNARNRSQTPTTERRVSTHALLTELDPQTSPFAAFDLERGSVASSLPDAENIGLAPSAVALEGASADARDAKDESAIYSTESTGVIPPVGVRPQLPTELPSNVNRADLIAIELVVAADGTVGSVRLVGTSRNMQNVMWLSAVKAFEFQPATKDGVPVKYRKVVWIATH